MVGLRIFLGLLPQNRKPSSYVGRTSLGYPSLCPLICGTGTEGRVGEERVSIEGDRLGINFGPLVFRVNYVEIPSLRSPSPVPFLPVTFVIIIRFMCSTSARNFIFIFFPLSISPPVISTGERSLPVGSYQSQCCFVRTYKSFTVRRFLLET